MQSIRDIFAAGSEIVLCSFEVTQIWYFPSSSEYVTCLPNNTNSDSHFKVALKLHADVVKYILMWLC